MFSILNDVIAVPDIATLSTHHMLGISRYTYALKCAWLTANGFVEEQDALTVWSLLAFYRGLLFQVLSLSNPLWQHWLQAVVAPLWLASGFGGLDGPLAVMFAKDCWRPPLLVGRCFLCFVLSRHKTDRLSQDCVVSWTIVVLLQTLFCIEMAQTKLAL